MGAFVFGVISYGFAMHGKVMAGEDVDKEHAERIELGEQQLEEIKNVIDELKEVSEKDRLKFEALQRQLKDEAERNNDKFDDIQQLNKLLLEQLLKQGAQDKN